MLFYVHVLNLSPPITPPSPLSLYNKLSFDSNF